MKIMKLGTKAVIPVSKQNLIRAGIGVNDEFDLTVVDSMIIIKKKHIPEKRNFKQKSIEEAPRPKQSGTYDFILNHL